jgi:Ras GTPase-activating-like protein IQGAP1
MDADRMDEKRKEHMAYEYLCHLEEAKQWIEACIEDELPTTTELEEALRNGVILCRLGHFYAPEILPLRKIYDRDQAKYHAKGLHFKHTDNFNWWLRTLEHVGLPKIFYPITTDLYDRKNMPRVIYCIHAVRFAKECGNYS